VTCRVVLARTDLGFAVRPRSLGWSARRIQARLQAERRGRPLDPTLRTKQGPTLGKERKGGKKRWERKGVRKEKVEERKGVRTAL